MSRFLKKEIANILSTYSCIKIEMDKQIIKVNIDNDVLVFIIDVSNYPCEALRKITFFSWPKNMNINKCTNVIKNGMSLIDLIKYIKENMNF